MAKTVEQKLEDGAYTYCPRGTGEAIFISYHSSDEQCFWGEGAVSGESYKINFNDVHPDDEFYKLVKMED